MRWRSMEVERLKIYDFTSKEKELGRVVFALTLDKKKLAERIIIGRADEVYNGRAKRDKKKENRSVID